MRTMVLAVALLAAAACARDTEVLQPDVQPQHQVSPGDTVELRVGETAGVPGTAVRIRFRGVQSDSRCPTDVTCVWEGDAEVLLDVIASGSTWQTHVVHTGVEPRAVNVGAYSVRVAGLLPLPVSTDSIRAADYRVKLALSAR